MSQPRIIPRLIVYDDLDPETRREYAAYLEREGSPDNAESLDAFLRSAGIMNMEDM